MSLLVDQLGVKYYWATKSLSDIDLENKINNPFRAKLLLLRIYELSELLESITSNTPFVQVINSQSFQMKNIRKITLLNFQNASKNIINNTVSANPFNYDILYNPILDSEWYCDELITLKKNSGMPSDKRIDTFGAKVKLDQFIDERGADGITMDQWLVIKNIRGGSGIYFDVIREQNRINNIVEAKLKRQVKAQVYTGELEEIKLEPKFIEKKPYSYFGELPEQVPFLISSDDEIIKNLILWIIYINSGHPTKLVEIFGFPIYQNAIGQLIYLSHSNIREIVDLNENSVLLKYNKDFLNSGNALNTEINKVLLYSKKNEIDKIKFVGNISNNSLLDLNDSVILSIDNIEGKLLERIRMNVENMSSIEIIYEQELIDLKLNKN